jgi:hypothetical protein
MLLADHAVAINDHVAISPNPPPSYAESSILMQLDIFSLFNNRLIDHYSRNHVLVRRWSGGRSRNIVELTTTPQATLLYIKVSNLDRGFWGLNSNQLLILDQAVAKWFVVLLNGSTDRGFVLPSLDVKHAMQHQKWSLSEAGDYKVHDHEIRPKAHFRAFNTFISLIS